MDPWIVGLKILKWGLFRSIPAIIGYSIYQSRTHQRFPTFTIDRSVLKGNRVILPNHGNVSFGEQVVASNLGEICCRKEIAADSISVGVGTHLVLKNVCCKDLRANLQYGVVHQYPPERDPSVGDLTFRWNTY